jgi:hypothetical protein
LLRKQWELEDLGEEEGAVGAGEEEEAMEHSYTLKQLLIALSFLYPPHYLFMFD